MGRFHRTVRASNSSEDPKARNGEAECCLTMRWSELWTIVGRIPVANKLLAGSACGKQQRRRSLNSVVSSHGDTPATVDEHMGPFGTDSGFGRLHRSLLDRLPF